MEEHWLFSLRARQKRNFMNPGNIDPNEIFLTGNPRNIDPNEIFLTGSPGNIDPNEIFLTLRNIKQKDHSPLVLSWLHSGTTLTNN